MDIDEVQVEIEVTPAPDEDAHLALVTHFNPFPFTHDARNAIFARRSLMSDELIFDLLLEQASIASPQSLFPPDSPETLLDLLTAIAKCPWDSLKKSCLLFYLLSYVSPDVAAEHAANWALPAQFVHLAHACFLLDMGTPDDLAHAVSLLSDARIVQDMSSKILYTLSLASQPASSRLVRTYVRTAQPVLETYDDLAIYLRALLESSLADAWAFQRTFSETTPLRNQLFRTILDGCLVPPKPSVLPHLLSLPLTTFEFSLLHAYALSPPEELTPAAHSILQDLITVRLLHSGKYSDAIRLSRAFDSLNAKSRSGNIASLHKAAGDRQQMMRDVLAVVPEVQRRQLELEFNDEQADGEAAILGGSWTTMNSDVSMSWENLGASGGPKANERSRSGRLEGSPAPKPPGQPNIPNTPFGLFSSPAGSAQKRKMSAYVPANIFGTPTTTPARPTPSSVLPTIPTPGLDASIAAGTSSMSPAFRPPVRTGLGNTPMRNSQLGLNGVGQASTPRSGAGHDARNALVGLEPSRAPVSPFGGQARGETGDIFSTPRMRRQSVDGKDLSEKRPDADRMQEDGGPEQIPVEDVMMVDSDDPDGFVLRGRRRTLFRPPPPPQTQTANGDVDVNGHGSDADSGVETVDRKLVNGGGSTFFGRRDDATPRPGPPVRRKSSLRGKVLPGGFASFELTDDASAPSLSAPAPAPVSAPQQPPRHDQPTRAPSGPRTSRTTRLRRNGPPSSKPDAQKNLRIPGALFENDDDDEDDDGAAVAEKNYDDAREDQDNVPSLPSLPLTPSKPPKKLGRQRTRANRGASSATESGDDDDARKRSLRRSSRLSSAGISPEELSPPAAPHVERRAAPKRAGRASAASADGTARSTRKRRNPDE